MDKDNKSARAEPWLFRGVPALVAHRGNAQNYPENTLVAISAAVRAGASFVEFDIQLSKDGIPFLIHDDNLKRTAGLDLSVFDVTMSQLEKMSVGEQSRFGDKFLSEVPISLRVLCEYLNEWQEVHSFIEIKQQSIDHFGLEKVVNQILDATESLTAMHTLISFQEDAIDLIQQLSDRSTGLVVDQWGEHSMEMLEKLSPDFVFCNYQKIPMNESLLKRGSNWVLYEIDEPEKVTFSRSVGASLMETMLVEPMLELLQKGDY